MDHISRSGINESNSKLLDHCFQEELFCQMFNSEDATTAALPTKRQVKLLREGITASGRWDSFTQKAYLRFCHFYLEEERSFEDFIIASNVLISHHQEMGEEVCLQMKCVLEVHFLLLCSVFFEWSAMSKFFYKWQSFLKPSVQELAFQLLLKDSYALSQSKIGLIKQLLE